MALYLQAELLTLEDASSTSHVLAGKIFGIPVKDRTHAHSWVMAYDSEEEAFFEL